MIFDFRFGPPRKLILIFYYKKLQRVGVIFCHEARVHTRPIPNDLNQMGIHPLHVVLVTTIFMSNVSLNQAARSKLSSRQELAAKKKCKVQGFSDSLVCSTCNKLSIAVGEEGKNVVKECKSCCQNDGAVSYIQGVFSLCD